MLARTLFLIVLALCSSSAAFAKEWLIDVRTPEEFAAGHADGALNIEYQNIVTGVQALGVQKQEPVRVYCRSGRRSGIAQESLKEAGYMWVENLGSLEQAKAWQSQPQTGK